MSINIKMPILGYFCMETISIIIFGRLHEYLFIKNIYLEGCIMGLCCANNGISSCKTL